MGGNLTITPRAITVAADAGSRVFGAANPPFTYSVSEGGLVNGDRLFGALTTSATATSPAGVYPILIGTLGASPNYTLTFLGSQLTVTASETPSARPPQAATTVAVEEILSQTLTRALMVVRTPSTATQQLVTPTQAVLFTSQSGPNASASANSPSGETAGPSDRGNQARDDHRERRRSQSVNSTGRFRTAR
jgi:hypothetical protein